MPENLFTSIDEVMARPVARRTLSPVVKRTQPVAVDSDSTWEDRETVSATGATELAARFVSIEAFLAIQFLSGLLLFLPGAQSLRGIVRAAPYLSALAFFALYRLRRGSFSAPAGFGFLIAALALLAVGLLHPASVATVGVAQLVFQLCIAAPVFWVSQAVESRRRLERMLMLVFVMNLASASIGILQVYFPERFMPELSQALDESWLSSMSYVGANDRSILRPPGLSDTPGAASVAGGLTAIIGLSLCLRKRKTWQTALIMVAVGIGLAVVYLTQARTVLLMSLGSGALTALIAIHRGRLGSAWRIVALGGAVVVASFMWATSIGGEQVEDRFMNIRRNGAIQTFQQERGIFLRHTVSELLSEYPLGAGVGRWGMMNVYFADDRSAREAPPIYVEIQLTGWLLDGGILMWVFYGGAIVASVLAAYRMTGALDETVALAAVTVLAIQVFIAGMSASGPAFNTQMGILFWTAGAALAGGRRAES